MLSFVQTHAWHGGEVTPSSGWPAGAPGGMIGGQFRGLEVRLGCTNMAGGVSWGDGVPGRGTGRWVPAGAAEVVGS